MNRLLTFLLLMATWPLGATDVYWANSTLGSGSGTDAADAKACGVNGASMTYAAGQVTHLVGGILQDGITVGASGTSWASAVTIKFEPGAYMSSPCQLTTGSGIFIQNRQYVIIDGGGTNNGAIFCTANGFSLANGNSTAGVNMANCTNVMVQNLAMTNLYVPTANQNSARLGFGVLIADSSGLGNQNITVSNCLFHDEYWGVNVGISSGHQTNLTMINCTAYNAGQPGVCGGNSAGGIVNGVSFIGNHIYDFLPWVNPSGANHQDGIIIFEGSGGYVTNVIVSGNYIGPGYGGSVGGNTSGTYISGAVYGIDAHNNIFDCTDGTHPSDGCITFWVAGAPGNVVEQIYNNTVIGGGTGAAYTFYGDNSGNTFAAVYFTNNLAYNVTAYLSLEYYVDTWMEIYADYNVLSDITSPPILWGSGDSQVGADWTTDWQIQLGGTEDAHSQYYSGATPVCIAGSGPLPTGSPAIGAGLVVNGNTTGFNGLPLFGSIGAMGPSAGIAMLGNASGVTLIGAGPGTNAVTLIGTP